jgi:4-amino-4-deoxy-L-arabinose transferase-like glycosyltransferase
VREPTPTASRGPLVVALIAGTVVWAAGVFGHYGWFTDELYFLACARRPALGYVDHPPLATLLLGILRVVFDDNMALIRLVPTAAYGASIVLVGRLARSLGGGAFAQTLAAGIFATAPAVLVIAGFYSMNPFELLLAILLAQIAVSLTRGAPPRTWLVFGAVTGLALLNKHSALLPAALLAVATLASPARAHLATRWPYLGAALALVIAAPNLIWLVVNDGVTFEFYRISVPLKNIEQSPLEALVGQAMFVGPMVFVIAIAGAITLARQPSRRGFAVMFAIALAIMMMSGISRADRILAVYPLLFAAGACALERFTRERIWRRVIVIVTLVVGAVPPLPLVLPIFPPPLVVRYSIALAVTPQLEVAKRGAMPQWLGDKRGWPELVDATTAVFRTLSPDEQRRSVVFAADYGSAGALELYGRGLPRVISTHNEFWAWGPIDHATVLAVGHDEAYWTALYADVRRAGTVRCTGCLTDGMPIWIARGNQPGLAARWVALRRFE